MAEERQSKTDENQNVVLASALGFFRAVSNIMIVISEVQWQ